MTKGGEGRRGQRRRLLAPGPAAEWYPLRKLCLKQLSFSQMLPDQINERLLFASGLSALLLLSAHGERNFCPRQRWR